MVQEQRGRHNTFSSPDRTAYTSINIVEFVDVMTVITRLQTAPDSNDFRTLPCTNVGPTS